ncbi:MAG: hypothetical protein NTW03_01355, partial [Verrucomicrobia bacterium]|nr:hypothetical protein [Verrucomicrobiota bacterium]
APPLAHAFTRLFGLSRPSPSVLLFELAAAIGLSLVYYWLVSDYALGIPNNSTNASVFRSLSLANFSPGMLYDPWKGRLLGLLLTGSLFDFLVSSTSGTYEHFCMAFGLYQSLWLFLLFLVVIVALPYAFFINLGIFLGVMQTFFPVSGLYFYPWDIPATLFFTLAVLFFAQRRLGLMVVAIGVGSFFKETVLVCALLVFFHHPWPWWRRCLVFLGITALYLSTKRLLVGELGMAVGAAPMAASSGLYELAKGNLLGSNLRTLFSVNGLYVVFANAGTLAAVFFYGRQRRFVPYMVVICAFLAGQAIFGVFLEFRIFMQILPLSLIILSERLSSTWQEKSSGTEWAMRDSFWGLPLITNMLAILCLAAMLWRCAVIGEKSRITARNGNGAKIEAELPYLIKVSQWYRSAYVDAAQRRAREPESRKKKAGLEMAFNWFGGGLYLNETRIGDILTQCQRPTDAMNHYRVAADTALGFPRADQRSALTLWNNLAWFLAAAGNAEARNGVEAVRLAERACEVTEYKVPVFMGTLAAAYAEAGRFQDAVRMGKRAASVAHEHGEKDIAARNEELLKLYEANQPYHEAAGLR